MRWLDRKIIPTFLMVSTLDVLYHRAKFGEDRTTRAGCRCEMWCLFFFQSRSDAGGLCVRGLRSSNKYYVTVYGSILMRF